jgi:xylulokinase
VETSSQSKPTGPVTVGIDVGTTSVKALAVDQDGRVLERVRLPHVLHVDGEGAFCHDAGAAWWDGPQRALVRLAHWRPVAVAVAAMMPSMAVVDGAGQPVGPGLLYGDVRGRRPDGEAERADPTGSGETARLAAWAMADARRREVPAAGCWPALAVAGAALSGVAAVDLGTAFASGPLLGSTGWDPQACAEAGITPEQLPAMVMPGERVAPLRSWPGVALELPADLVAGSVDGFCEQLVSGVAGPGEALVILGSTLVAWVGCPGWPTVDGLWTVPHTTEGLALVGGASNAGGLWVDWADRVLAAAGPAERPRDVPLWQPWIRGERTPWFDPELRAGMQGGLLSQDAGALRRAALEASAFTVRNLLERAPTAPTRLVVSGGGVRNRDWLQALADTVNQPVEPVAVPEGGAFGAAFLARVGVGLDPTLNHAARWARTADPVEPDRAWVGATGERYERWCRLVPPPPGR